MEPITHFLTGACLARAGFNRKTALATATMTLAAEAPDIDIIGNFKDPVFGFAHHRGFTHSFLGLVLVQSVVVGLMYLVWRMRGRKLKDPKLPPRWGVLFVFACLAGLTHILLDFTNNYGVRPFWPFRETWYSWDIVFIVEPVILILLVAGLVLPALFSLINDEIGVRRRGPQGGLAAMVALLGVLALWGVRDYEHRRAVHALEARVYDGADPIRASAYPYWLNPFRWYGVVETRNFYATMLVDSSIPEADPEGRMRIRPKPEQDPVTLAAKRSYLGRVYLDWAKYPITETEPVENSQAAYVVRFQDLRYDYPDQTRRGVLGASVKLDRDLNVVTESFGSRGRRVANGTGKP
ncbi:MAG TPA: metal-dependent hydrolase [Terriglobales bacterium]|nr:metal-dependent hydrolase [Terriglobales bacterium]